MTGNPALHKCTTLVSALVHSLLSSLSCYSYLFTFLLVPVLALFAFSLLSRLSHCYSSSPPTGAVLFRFLWSLTTISSSLSSPFSLDTRFLSCYCFFDFFLHLKVALKTSHVHSLALHPARVILAIYWR